MSGPNLTPGDPLGGGGGGGARPAPAPPVDAPPRTSGYTSERPPGAGGLGSATPVPRTSGSPATGPELELAGWWRRVGAACIDGFVVAFVALLFAIPLGIGAAGADTDAGFAAAIGGIILLALVFVVVALLYAPVLMAKTNGQTLGRMATGIRVVRTSGEAMDFKTAAVREVALKWLAIGVVAGLPTGGLAGLLDVLWPLWDEENRALHDFPVKTRTVVA